MGENTPPRSPTKEVLATGLEQHAKPAETIEDNMDQKAVRQESIRIYADSDIYALLADVEHKFNHLGIEGVQTPGEATIGLQSAAA
jgi:hypothetical protein